MDKLHDLYMQSFRGFVIASGVYASIMLNLFGAVLPHSDAIALATIYAFAKAAAAFLMLLISLMLTIDNLDTPDIPFGNKIAIGLLIIGVSLELWSVWEFISEVASAL